METIILVGSKIKHLPTNTVCEVVKINSKTFEVLRLKKGYTTIHENVLVKKTDCEFYVEPPKVLSPYESYRKRVKENATKLPKAPKEIDQHLLWLKASAIERIEELDNLIGKDIFTFRVHNGKEISLTESMNLDNKNESYKFGFSEHYVNLLMHYAYNEGKKNATDKLTENYDRATKKMKAALDKIKDALDDADWIEYSDIL
jgi:hypothetical protein